MIMRVMSERSFLFFYKNIKELFDTDKGVLAHYEYNKEQMLSLLRTGSV